MRVIACLLAALLASQASPTFRSNVERVQVDVSVTRDGRPVPGLSASDFVLTDNGEPQDLESAILEDVPLSVQLVLDTSASVSGERLTHLVEASRGLLAALTPRDWAGLITFSNVVEIRAPLYSRSCRSRTCGRPRSGRRRNVPSGCVANRAGCPAGGGGSRARAGLYRWQRHDELAD